MLRKLDHFLFVGIHVGIFAFLLYGLTRYLPNHPMTLIFWMTLLIVGIMTIISKVSDYEANKRLEAYINNGFRE